MVFRKFHRKPSTQVTIYNTGGTNNHNFHENSHNVTHTSTTDSYNNSSSNHRYRVAGTQPPDFVSPQNVEHENQLAYNAQGTFCRGTMASSTPAQSAQAQLPRQKYDNYIPVTVPTPSTSSTTDHLPGFKAKNPFNNPFNPFRLQSSQVPYLDATALNPLAFQILSEPLVQPCAQRSDWEKFLERVSQDSPGSEEHDGMLRRCPTCGNLSTRNFFNPAPLYSPHLSEHTSELYAGSYLSPLLDGAPPRTPCRSCGKLHNASESSSAQLHAATADHQTVAQPMNPFTSPQPCVCPLVVNSSSFPQASLCPSRVASHLDTSVTSFVKKSVE